MANFDFSKELRKIGAFSCSQDNGDFARFVLFVFFICFEIGSLASHVVISLVYIRVAKKKQSRMVLLLRVAKNGKLKISLYIL